MIITIFMEHNLIAIMSYVDVATKPINTVFTANIMGVTHLVVSHLRWVIFPNVVVIIVHLVRGRGLYIANRSG